MKRQKDIIATAPGQKLLIGIGIGILLGVICGWFFGPKILFVKVLGDLFLRALRMIVVPLVVFSMIVGISQLGDIRKLGRTGSYTIFYYMCTTAISVIIGLLLVNIIQPGIGAETSEIIPDKVRDKAFTFSDMLLSFVPENLFAAAAETDVLPLIFFSLLFGGVLTTIGDKGKVVLEFCEGVNEVIMKIVHIIMLFAPIGIFGLIAGKLGEVGGGDEFMTMLSQMGWYASTVILGLLFHAFVALTLLLVLLGKRNPLEYGKNMLSALATAFSTASSSATLPLTLDCVQEKNKVPARTASFVLPLGATVNMDGTALYEAVAAMFIAQAYGLHMGLWQQILIALTATLASIGAAGIPEAGLVTMVIVFEAVGLPLEGIQMILVIDWFLDRCRTTVNVWGDSVGCAVIANMVEEDVDGG